MNHKGVDGLNGPRCEDVKGERLLEVYYFGGHKCEAHSNFKVTAHEMFNLGAEAKLKAEVGEHICSVLGNAMRQSL